MGGEGCLIMVLVSVILIMPHFMVFWPFLDATSKNNLIFYGVLKQNSITQKVIGDPSTVLVEVSVQWIGVSTVSVLNWCSAYLLTRTLRIWHLSVWANALCLQVYGDSHGEGTCNNFKGIANQGQVKFSAHSLLGGTVDVKEIKSHIFFYFTGWIMNDKKDQGNKEEQEAKKPVKNAVDLQKLKLEKLFKNIVSWYILHCLPINDKQYHR